MWAPSAKFWNAASENTHNCRGACSFLNSNMTSELNFNLLSALLASRTLFDVHIPSFSTPARVLASKEISGRVWLEIHCNWPSKPRIFYISSSVRHLFFLSKSISILSMKCFCDNSIFPRSIAIFRPVNRMGTDSVFPTTNFTLITLRTTSSNFSVPEYRKSSTWTQMRPSHRSLFTQTMLVRKDNVSYQHSSVLREHVNTTVGEHLEGHKLAFFSLHTTFVSLISFGGRRITSRLPCKKAVLMSMALGIHSSFNTDRECNIEKHHLFLHISKHYSHIWRPCYNHGTFLAPTSCWLRFALSNKMQPRILSGKANPLDFSFSHRFSKSWI